MKKSGIAVVVLALASAGALVAAEAAPAAATVPAVATPPPAATAPPTGETGEQATAQEVLALYEKIQAALAADSTTGVVAAAATIAEKAAPCTCGGESEAAQQALVAAAKSMTGTDLAALREQLKALSRTTAVYLRTVGATGAQIFYCPMAPGYWLQKAGEEMRNPYYGPAMLECGAPVDAIAD
jgi:hypothetical protein